MITTSDGEVYENETAHAYGVSDKRVSENDPNQAMPRHRGEVEVPSDATDYGVDAANKFIKDNSLNKNDTFDMKDSGGKSRRYKYLGPDSGGEHDFMEVKPPSIDPRVSMNEPKKLYIIRHGKTDMNNETSTSQDFIRGWKDIPLNDEGRQEAHTTADKMASMDNPPSVLHHSDLDRAEETAKIIGSKTGLDPVSSRELRPWDLGYLTGKTTEEALPVIKDYIENKPDERVPKGESFNEFKQRAFRGVFNALSSSDGPTAIVTHHRVERLLEAWDKKGQPSDLSVDVNTFGQKGDEPGGIKELEINPKTLSEGSPEAAQMTHQVESENKALPVIKVTEAFFKGGLHQVLKDQGVKFPDWVDKAANIINSESFQTALGMLGGIPAGRAGKVAQSFAESLEKSGADALRIKQLTGMERGAEGMWRNEFSDKNAKLNIPERKYPSLLDKNKTYSELKEGNYKAEDIFNHPELYERYPDFAKKTIHVYKMPSISSRGWYNDEDRTIVLNSAHLKNNEEAKSTLLHEFTHGIQHEEGFSIGTFPLEVRDKVIKAINKQPKDRTEEEQKIFQIYYHQAHEVEARNVQARAILSEKEIKNSLAKETEEIPRDKQVLFEREGSDLRAGRPFIGSQFSSPNKLPPEDILKHIKKGDLPPSKPFNPKETEKSKLFPDPLKDRPFETPF